MKYQKIEYPDGTFYSKIEEFSKEFIFRINSYQDLWMLKQIKEVYDFNNKNAIVTIPNLLDAQADRRFNSNESANLKLVLHELNNMNWEKLKIFHPHNSEIVEAIINKVEIIDNTEFIYEVLSKIKNTQYDNSAFDLENDLILMSTDAGGFKPLMKLCDKIQWSGETFSASKSRKYENGVSKLIQQIDKKDFNNKSVLIIDDLCVYGGTFLGLSNLLKEKNVNKIYLAVSHITVTNPNSKLESAFDKIFTTNSKYNTYISNNNLEIIKLF